MLSIKVISVTPLDDMRLLVAFENGIVKIFDVKPIIKDFPEYAALENTDLFNLVQVEAGGYGIAWNSELDASEGELWENGVEAGLRADDLSRFVKYNVVVTAEVAEMLSCSRQNIDDLMRRNKLVPLKAYQSGKLFLKSDVERRQT
jgi:hypothetical protein